MTAQPGDLMFLWGDSWTDKIIRTLSGGPSHVRLCLGGDRVAEMVTHGFQYGTLDLPVGASGTAQRGPRQELVAMHLDAEMQQRCLAFVKAHEHERYSYLACVSQFLNVLGSPFVMDRVNEMNCSQFASCADGIDDYCLMTPARLYLRVRGGG
jgi:hypothetical protein